YGVGSYPGSVDIVPKTRTLSPNVTFTIPNSSAGVVYFVVTGYSGAMLNATQTVKMMLMTGPPEIAGAVVEYSQMGRFLQWRNFGEPVSSYYVGIGTKLGGNDLLNWTMISDSASTSGPFLSGLCSGIGCGTPLLPSQIQSMAVPVWFSIRADNQAGFWSQPVSVAFPTLLFGSDAALVLPTGNLTTSSSRGFEDLSAVATISAQLPADAAQSIAILPIGPYQVSTSQLTGISLTRPPLLLTIRAGASYARYGSVHLHLASTQENGALASTLPIGVPINASISVQNLYSTTIGAPTIYYQGPMTNTLFKSFSWTSQLTVTDTGAKTVQWLPSAPGIYALYYNSTFPSFADLNADALGEILLIETDSGWGLNSSRRYTASLSPSYNSTVDFSPTFVHNETIAAVGDFHADGSLAYVLGATLDSNRSTLSYTIVLAQSAATMKLNTPAVGAFPQLFKQHALLGFVDIDDDTFLDSIWYSTSELSTDWAISICADGGEYAAGCKNPLSVSFQPFYSAVGVGSWSAGSCSILTYNPNSDGTVSFSIVGLLVAKSAAGAVTSISSLAPLVVSRSLSPQPGQSWRAHVPGDMSGDGISDIVLQCTSETSACGISKNLTSETIIWYLNPSGKVVSDGILSNPWSSRLALGSWIARVPPAPAPAAL
ncbi:hypothetical protein HDU87_001237, partial [Geranomyces variabilis]